MPSNPVVKLKRGSYSALSSYPTIDGTLYFGVDATPTLSQAEKGESAAYSLFVLDMDDGTGSIVRKTLDSYRALYAKEAGSASTADIWSTASIFKIQDNDGTNTEANGISVNGSANTYTLKLPATIKASITGNLTGIADKAKLLVDSNGSLYSVGSSTKPVYFSNGIPVAVDSVDATASAADKWSSARGFHIEDSYTGTGGPHAGATVQVNGDSALGYTLKLPTTIEATIMGTATAATKLVNGSGADYEVGSATQPVYFDNGVPVVMGTTLGSTTSTWTIYGDLHGTADKADALTVSSKVGDTDHPVFFSGQGVPVAVTSVDASLISGVINADNLPASVKERMIIVTDENAMKALTTTNAQLGDTVRLSGSGQAQTLYYIVSSDATSLPTGTITGTNFKFVPYSAGNAAQADNALTADTLSSTKYFSITGGIGADQVGFNGSGNVALSALTLNFGSFTTINGKLGSANGGTGFNEYVKGDIIYASATNTLSKLSVGSNATGKVLVVSSNGVPAWTSPSSITGVGTADTLSSTKTINGTGFNGSQNIVTDYWGTQREFTIKDSSETHSGGAIGVNGSAAVTLLLPATITATLNGKADTAGTADKVAHTFSIQYTNVGGVASTAVDFDGSSTQSINITADNLFYKFTTNPAIAPASNTTAGTWLTVTRPTGMASGTYIVQIQTNNGTFNTEMFSGVMSFYDGTCEKAATASDSNEVLLHSCGKNAKAHNLFLRTRRQNNGLVVIEFSADVNLTTSDQFTFTFRRMI